VEGRWWKVEGEGERKQEAAGGKRCKADKRWKVAGRRWKDRR